MKTEDLFWLAVNVYHEARGEVFDGQVAVCHVVLNRAVARKSSVYAIVTKPFQFSWANGSARPPIKDYAAFERCMKAAMTAEADRAQGDSLAGADHYYAFSGPNAIKEPSWVKAGKMREVARIGNHVFFRS